MQPLTRAPDKPLPPEVGVLALAALYFLCRPLVGFLTHDAMFYAFQALFRVEGWPLGDDLIKRFGSQSEFSLFPAIYARLVDDFGLIGANIRLLVISVLLWIGALWMLIRALFETLAQRVLAFGLVLALAPHYGNGVLSYGETFLTSRIFAEAMGLFALASLTGRRPMLGLAALFVAAAAHPLVALGVFGIWLAFLVGHTLRFVTALAFVGLLFGVLGQAGLAPFDWLFEAHDPAWAAHLSNYESLGFMTSWGYRLFVVPALPLLVLLLIRDSPNRTERRLARAVLFVSLIGVALSLVGSELLGNRLLTALQLWRALGWLALVGNLLALRLLVGDRLDHWSRLLLLMALVVNIIEHFIGTMPAFSAALALLAVSHHLSIRTAPDWRFVHGTLRIASAVVFAAFGAVMLSKLQLDGGSAAVSLARGAMVCLVLFAVARMADVPGAITCGAALGLALWSFDARTPWQRFIDAESGDLPQALVQRLEQQTVYWEQGLPIMWFKLNQPQFYSCNQKAGSLFYRRQGLEFERRAAALRPLGTADFDPRRARFCPASDAGPRTENSLRKACRAAPLLDIIVLESPISGVQVQSWQVPENDPIKSVFVYECADFR